MQARAHHQIFRCADPLRRSGEQGPHDVRPEKPAVARASAFDADRDRRPTNLGVALARGSASSQLFPWPPQSHLTSVGQTGSTAPTPISIRPSRELFLPSSLQAPELSFDSLNPRPQSRTNPSIPPKWSRSTSVRPPRQCSLSLSSRCNFADNLLQSSTPPGARPVPRTSTPPPRSAAPS